MASIFRQKSRQSSEVVALRAYSGLYLIFVVISLVFGVISTAHASDSTIVDGEFVPSSEYVTVPELHRDADSLDGKKVRLRGWANFGVLQTLMGCGYDECCNGAYPTLFLSQRKPLQYDRESGEIGKSNFTAGIELRYCGGNECEVTCRDFDPSKAGAFELVGVVARCEECYQKVRLIDIDLEKSKEFKGGVWSRIPIEPAVITLRVPACVYAVRWITVMVAGPGFLLLLVFIIVSALLWMFPGSDRARRRWKCACLLAVTLIVLSRVLVAYLFERCFID